MGYLVYKHVAPNGKVYIGITSQSAEERWRNGRGYRNCPLFHNAICKYGWDNISHEILFDGLSKEDAEQKEIDLIVSYKSNNPEYGYNIDSGGCAPCERTAETRKKIGDGNRGKIVSEETRKRMRENHADFCGAKNPNYGKRFSEEQRKAMSKAHIGKQVGKENPMYGKKHTKKAKELQSKNRIGKCTGKSNPKSRGICQYDQNGNLIAKYGCISEAEKVLGTPRGSGGHISACAKGKLKSAYGLVWKYVGSELIGTV